MGLLKPLNLLNRVVNENIYVYPFGIGLKKASLIKLLKN